MNSLKALATCLLLAVFAIGLAHGPGYSQSTDGAAKETTEAAVDDERAQLVKTINEMIELVDGVIVQLENEFVKTPNDEELSKRLDDMIARKKNLEQAKKKLIEGQ